MRRLERRRTAGHQDIQDIRILHKTTTFITAAVPLLSRRFSSSVAPFSGSQRAKREPSHDTSRASTILAVSVRLLQRKRELFGTDTWNHEGMLVDGWTSFTCSGSSTRFFRNACTEPHRTQDLGKSGQSNRKKHSSLFGNVSQSLNLSTRKENENHFTP